ncbi:MAG: hypothetical protein ABIZ52_04050 [Candidatus Limnocylindrales bacterium]
MLKTRLLPGAMAVSFLLAACGAAAAPSPSPLAAPTPRPTPTAVPGDPGGGIGNGGGTDPGSGSGILFPPLPGGGPNDNPIFGAATYLQPSKGLVNPRTVNVQLVRAVVNADGSATADLRWWSGVAPCSQLDHVEIVKDEAAKTIRLKVIEGSGAGDVACIDIAQLSATAVDLGTLASGTWTISAEGDAPAIPLDIP